MRKKRQIRTLKVNRMHQTQKKEEIEETEDMTVKKELYKLYDMPDASK